MPSPSNIVAPRAPKAKSAKAKAKAAANIAAYNARCAALKAGTFKGIVEQAAEAKARAAAERMAETAKARSAVVAAMNHPQYGARLTKWLGHRKDDPCRLMVIIRNWMITNGIVEHTLPIS